MMLFDIAILLVQAAFSQPEQVLYGIVLVITTPSSWTRC